MYNEDVERALLLALQEADTAYTNALPERRKETRQRYLVALQAFARFIENGQQPTALKQSA